MSWSVVVGWGGVYCLGQLPAYFDTQISEYVGTLFNDYCYLVALRSVGADVSVIRPYFASESAYATAAISTGAQPLEGSSAPAGSIGADSVNVSGHHSNGHIGLRAVIRPGTAGRTPSAIRER